MTAATPTPTHRRHDISDRAWDTIAPHLSGGPGKVGRPAEDNRRFSNAVFWILRTGAHWCDLPLDYGHWNTTTHRFGDAYTKRWRRTWRFARYPPWRCGPK